MINGVFSRSSSFQKTKTSFFEEEECEITEGDEGGMNMNQCGKAFNQPQGHPDKLALLELAKGSETPVSLTVCAELKRKNVIS